MWFIIFIDETVTATVDEGGYVFWYAGGGVSDLIGIEFDASSREKLAGDPTGWVFHKFWVATVNQNTGDELLKYDILYQHFDDDGESELIRLDPKIKVAEQ
ncbi:MAG: hypothetical protein AAFN93_30280 [Bacteroidota bacterium]